MADFVARTSATKISAGTSGAARMTQGGDLLVLPYEWQLALEGRVFIAGHGLEETATDGEAALDETTPTFALVGPDSGTIVVPLVIKVRMHAEGGAAPDWYLSYVQADKSVGDTGTALGILNVLGGTSPRLPKGLAYKTVSAVTAITDAQTVLLARQANILDNLVSVEMATTRAQVESPGFNTLEYTWNREEPFMLYGGSSILVHTGTATTDSTYSITLVWAELDSDIYANKA